VASTIRDVALESGVSVSTVSRAFTMPELVKAETLEQVRKAAAKLRYQPNRAARALITGRTGNLGIVVPDLTNPFFPAVVKGAQTRARELDQCVFLADADEDPRQEQELILHLVKQVDGFVLCASRLSTEQVRSVLQTTRVVFINRQVPGAPSVMMDPSGAQQAIAHLAALRHERIAYVNGPGTSWSNRERRKALRSAATKAGVELVEFGPFTPSFEAGIQAGDLVIASAVTAVVAYNDLMALGILTRLNDRKVSVPQDMSVIGFDDIAMAAMATPSLTTVALPKEEAGRVAVDLLLAVLAEEEAPTRRLPTQLIVRGSTGPRRPS
jgi:DNA-binding LacI/PurR family transcriptional regulator